MSGANSGTSSSGIATSPAVSAATFAVYAADSGLTVDGLTLHPEEGSVSPPRALFGPRMASPETPITYSLDPATGVLVVYSPNGGNGSGGNGGGSGGSGGSNGDGSNGSTSQNICCTFASGGALQDPAPCAFSTCALGSAEIAPVQCTRAANDGLNCFITTAAVFNSVIYEVPMLLDAGGGSFQLSFGPAGSGTGSGGSGGSEGSGPSNASGGSDSPTNTSGGSGASNTSGGSGSPTNTAGGSGVSGGSSGSGTGYPVTLKTAAPGTSPNTSGGSGSSPSTSGGSGGSGSSNTSGGSGSTNTAGVSGSPTNTSGGSDSPSNTSGGSGGSGSSNTSGGSGSSPTTSGGSGSPSNTSGGSSGSGSTSNTSGGSGSPTNTSGGSGGSGDAGSSNTSAGSGPSNTSGGSGSSPNSSDGSSPNTLTGSSQNQATISGTVSGSAGSSVATGSATSSGPASGTSSSGRPVVTVESRNVRSFAYVFDEDEVPPGTAALAMLDVRDPVTGEVESSEEFVVQYMGCYGLMATQNPFTGENATDKFRNYMASGDEPSPGDSASVCASYCAGDGETLSSNNQGTCFCGEFLTSTEAGQDRSFCRAPCPKDANQRCGGGLPSRRAKRDAESYFNVIVVQRASQVEIVDASNSTSSATASGTDSATGSSIGSATGSGVSMGSATGSGNAGDNGMGSATGSATGSGNGGGNGMGSATGSATGSGDGMSSATGSANGGGNGMGSVTGSGNGMGSATGSATGSGNGAGNGMGSATGSGDGSGNGMGSATGSGNGSGNGMGSVTGSGNGMGSATPGPSGGQSITATSGSSSGPMVTDKSDPIILEVVPKTEADSMNNNAVQGRSYRRAEVAGFIGGAGPVNPLSCADATTFNLRNGELLSGGQKIATDPNTPFAPFRVDQEGTISTVFSIVANTYLAWTNALFPIGSATFCQGQDGQVYALFASTALPFECTPVVLMAYSALQCRDGTLVTQASTIGFPSMTGDATNTGNGGDIGQTGLPGSSYIYPLGITSLPSNEICTQTNMSWVPGEATFLRS
ncbi:hypothetical protein LQW54_003703 [Pestalotiopsis sp. IQ-011]